MNIIGRMKRITTANVELFLTRAEDPEALFPQVLREMEEQVRTLVSAEAKALAGQAARERDLLLRNQRLAVMANGAQSSLKAGNEELAREALAAVMRLEEEIHRQRAEVEALREVTDAARQARMDAEATLEELRAKKDELVSRARVLRARENIAQSVQGPSLSGKGLLDVVSRMEASVNEREAVLDLGTGGGAKTGDAALRRRIEAQNHGAEIERRLAALKEQLREAV